MSSLKKYYVAWFESEYGIGARAGDILIATDKTHKGFTIRISQDQRSDPGSDNKDWYINGGFEILSAGEGKFAKYLKQFIGKTMTADELRSAVNRLQSKAGTVEPSSRGRFGYVGVKERTSQSRAKEGAFSHAANAYMLRIKCPNEECDALLEELDRCHSCGWSRKA